MEYDSIYRVWFRAESRLGKALTCRIILIHRYNNILKKDSFLKSQLILNMKITCKSLQTTFCVGPPDYQRLSAVWSSGNRKFIVLVEIYYNESAQQTSEIKLRGRKSIQQRTRFLILYIEQT